MICGFASPLLTAFRVAWGVCERHDKVVAQFESRVKVLQAQNDAAYSKIDQMQVCVSATWQWTRSPGD